MINSYVLSILIFPIRVAKLPKGFANKVYLAIRSCLGSRGTRVRLTRLLGARSYGGYGLINLKEMALRLKRTWLQYFIVSEESLFLKIVNRWNTEVKQNLNCHRGPLLSGCDKVPGFCWSSLMYAWKSPWRCFNHKGVYGVYQFNQLDDIIEIVNFSESCGVDSQGIHYAWNMLSPLMFSEMEVLRKYTSSFYWRNKVVGYHLGCKRDWKLIKELKKTPAQKRWVLGGHNYMEWIKGTKIPRVKMWGWDAININLPVRYKVDVCLNCNKLIGSDHFLWNCPLINKLSLHLSFSPVEIAFLIWRMHCALKHNKKEIFIHMFWAVQWLLFDKCDIKKRWIEIKQIFQKIIQEIGVISHSENNEVSMCNEYLNI
ncbi:MAG TPA: hypothetical protein PKD85_16180 [Saprospiraceae bacterium]|nr:hypothetical protein [Saprospiraceae bacterium]